MNLHEFQAKQLFRDFGIPVLSGATATTAQEAVEAAKSLGGTGWVVKAQVHAGGRGKAGGVKLANNLDQVRDSAQAMLGSTLKTKQTGEAGLPINRVLIEPQCEIKQEFYVAAVVDRGAQRVTLMATRAGGTEVEEAAAANPSLFVRERIDPVVGLMPYQIRNIGFGLGMPLAQVNQLAAVLNGIYALFIGKDASLVEINPLILTGDDKLIALDAKINIDDNALYRHSDITALHDPTQEDAKELEAQKHNLNYISLNGSIGCMVNGAGLAMATMDLIKLHGGEPANFLDVGGGTTKERVAEAFKLILSDTKVKAVLVNIFGGIVRCDLIAEGIISAVRDVKVNIPVVVRLEGTNAEAGRKLLSESGLALTAGATLTDAAQKVVRAALGGQV